VLDASIEDSFMRRLLILLFATAALGRLACGQQNAHELTEEEIGSVHFLTTCSKTTEASFGRAVALLHSFQYELARSVFTDISSLDQNCAMAYWGIGMDYRLEPLSVREFSENVVITLYRATVHSRDSTGANESTHASRLTHTWMKTEKGWRIIGGMSADDVTTALSPSPQKAKP